MTWKGKSEEIFILQSFFMSFHSFTIITNNFFSEIEGKIIAFWRSLLLDPKLSSRAQTRTSHVISYLPVYPTQNDFFTFSFFLTFFSKPCKQLMRGTLSCLHFILWVVFYLEIENQIKMWTLFSFSAFFTRLYVSGGNWN